MNKKLKIGIDARFAIKNRRGIGNYTLKLIQNLAEIDKVNQYILYVDSDDIEGVLPKQSNFSTKKLLISNYLIWEQILLPFVARFDNIEILHCTGNTAPVFLSKKIKLIVTIHDVMYLKDYSLLPKSASMYQRIGRIYRKYIVRRVISKTFRIITDSEFSKIDILHHFPKIAPNNILVVYAGMDTRFHIVDKNKELCDKVKSSFNIKNKYILALGATDPRKNTEFIIKSYLEIKKDEKIKESLVVLGIKNWKKTKLFELISRHPNIKDVIVVGFVEDDDIVALYNCAELFVYPSLYEGFGLPVLEAMACGVPVITSNKSCLPEISGGAAVLVDPTSNEDFKNAIINVVNNKQMKDDMRIKGLERTKAFSWMKMASRILSIYEIAGKK
ncbi:hypothetical protein A3J90_05820 [candidate division WOR-1 bacterium RIFOXYC2_FULL_37_10]|uniref:Glycosyl transferase family 1 domain-containing protein n=1 Tax=candidate division WOR-1 bacterium RIFOXYB2_FULL_37_13 TaxID=1802579 RepID=A0A1F4SQ29_UNCSA|nr:MAG: hypothetical protein A2310_07245 [candidate division WOR-1 bacterium RIFOXYB2_FULL_37_13]OGC34903.1 MAG: hypothetical protein A3J90_05820 [candidate division WOR-1 bacterium RIFOXYC2_FULL_37_10]